MMVRTSSELQSFGGVKVVVSGPKFDFKDRLAFNSPAFCRLDVGEAGAVVIVAESIGVSGSSPVACSSFGNPKSALNGEDLQI